MPTAAPGHWRPTLASERVELLDALRGFALFGILLMNLADFSGYSLLSDARRGALPTAAMDHAMLVGLATLFHGKFYTVFSLLFGVGVALQLERGATAGRFVRRFFWLFVFGFLHLVIIWPGDILAPYALAGLILLVMLRLTDRVLLSLAVLLIAAPVVLHWLYVRLGIDPRAAVLSIVERLTDARALASGGSWTDAIFSNLLNPLRRLANLLGENRMLKIVGVFAIGLVVGRRGIFREPAAWRPLLIGLLVTGIVVGLPSSLAFEWLSDDEYFPASALGVRQSIAYALGVVPLGLAWASGFALLWLRPAWRRRLAVFAPAGRMALSNYLAQSIICAPIFVLSVSGAGTAGPMLWPLITAAIIALQIVWSKAWLARHRHGPLEGVWRRLTYGRAPSSSARA